MSGTTSWMVFQTFKSRKQLVLVFVLNIIVINFNPSHQEKSNCSNVTYKNHIQNVTYLRTKIEALQPTARISLKYNVSFPVEKCCPLIDFETENTLEENSHRDPIQQCYLEKIQNVVLLSHYYIYLNEWNSNSGCMKRGSYYVCSGTRAFYVGIKSQWYFDVGYKCRMQQNLDISVEIEFMCNVQKECENVRFDYCKNLFNYSQTSFPNTLGQPSQKIAYDTLQTVLLAFNEHFPCYKYANEFMCYSLFPSCVNDRPIIPCKQTCTEVVTACDFYLKFYKQPLYCGSYPSSIDPDVCFYKPVVCEEEEDPEFGRIIRSGTQPFNITEVECNPGYKAVGDRIRHCLYNGFLNGTKPKCVLKMNANYNANSSNNTVIITATAASFILVILLGVLAILFRKNIILLLKHNRLASLNLYQVAQGQNSLFITYSSEDRESVQNDLVPLMKFELPMWNILTYQENFIGGDKLLDAIHKGIWESAAVIAVVTPNYLRSEWCKHEFQEAQTRSASNKQFKFIVLFTENVSNNVWDELPEPMRKWILGRVYLILGEHLFWNKLRRALRK